MNIIIVPQLKIAMRYTEWWPEDFKNGISDKFRYHRSGKAFTVTLLNGLNKRASQKPEKFASLFDMQSNMVKHELLLVHELQRFLLQPSDIVICLDACTPGIVAGYLRNLHRSKRPLLLGFCHGSSFNTGDMYDESRHDFDLTCLSTFDVIFVATEYHKRKLRNAYETTYEHRATPQIISLGALPDMPFYKDKSVMRTTVGETLLGTSVEPVRKVAIIDRYGQKRNDKLIADVIQLGKGKYEFFDIYGQSESWAKYFSALACYLFVLVTTQEETYGYQIRDALHAGVIPICPQRFSFPELLRHICLYKDDNAREIIDKMDYLADRLSTGNIPISDMCLNNHLVNNFYERFCKEIADLLYAIAYNPFKQGVQNATDV